MSAPDLSGPADLAVLAIVAFAMLVLVLCVAIAVFTRRAASVELRLACQDCLRLAAARDERLDAIEFRLAKLEMQAGPRDPGVVR